MSTNVIRITESRAVYTVEQVGELLDLSRGATYARVQNGEIPAKKIGARWVIPKARFHAWLNGLDEPTLEDIARELLAAERAFSATENTRRGA